MFVRDQLLSPTDSLFLDPHIDLIIFIYLPTLCRSVQTRPVQQGFKREDCSFDVKYNFVLLGDGRLVFVRIPKKKTDLSYRILSKHTVLVRYSSNARFAGEMRLVAHEHAMLVNNNSGTY